MILRKYTLKQLKQAIKTSFSVRQVLNKLNVAEYGGNYYTFHKAVKYFEIDISHFTGQASNKGKIFGPKRPIEDYLSNKFPINSHKLKKRLIKENFFLHQCNVCKNDSWLSKPIPLELNHIDGNHFNNSLKNLELLCPNCHALTENYRGKNIGVSKA